MNPETEPGTMIRPRPSWLRRIYDWTLSWADHPGGAWALFFLAVAESSFFPVPPDVLLIALAVGAVKKSFRFAAICTVGSVIGGIIGYGIGFWGYELIGEPIVNAYHGQEVMAKIEVWYRQWGFFGTLIAAITPIPYKVFTIASGAFHFPIWEFVFASVLGRGFRFFLVAAVIYRFGAGVRNLIERYFEWFAWSLLVLGVAGFVVLKYLK